MRYYGKTTTTLPTLKHFEKTAEGVLFQPMAMYNGTTYIAMDCDNEEALFNWIETTAVEIITEEHFHLALGIVMANDNNLGDYIETKQTVQELVEAVAVMIGVET